MKKTKRFVDVDKVAMAQGYLEMAEINANISQVELASEEEGWRLSHEMDQTRRAGGNA